MVWSDGGGLGVMMIGAYLGLCHVQERRSISSYESTTLYIYSKGFADRKVGDERS